MKAVFLLLVALSLVLGGNLRARVHYEYAFEQYRRNFGKDYANAEEFVYRLQVFSNNLDRIEVHNLAPSSYQMGVNKFTDMTQEEFENSAFCGCYSGVRSNKKAVQVSEGVAAGDVDWTAKGAVTPVKDQGQCGSCWAFSATGALEAEYFFEKEKLVSFSEQQLVDCSRSFGNMGCNGGLMDYAFEYVMKNGICLQGDYPYKAVDSSCKKSCKPAFQIRDYVVIAPTTEAALAAVVTKRPVAVAINASPIMSYKSGIFDSPCGPSLNHGVLATGYGVEGAKNYWRVKNSWGTGWGEKGYFRLIKDISQAGGACGIATAASYPTV